MDSESTKAKPGAKSRSVINSLAKQAAQNIKSKTQVHPAPGEVVFAKVTLTLYLVFFSLLSSTCSHDEQCTYTLLPLLLTTRLHTQTTIQAVMEKYGDDYRAVRYYSIIIVLVCYYKFILR